MLLGEDVPANEQINTTDKGKTAELLLEQSQIERNNEINAANVSKISDAERQNFEEERSKLYKQIDERVSIVTDHVRNHHTIIQKYHTSIVLISRFRMRLVEISFTC